MAKSYGANLHGFTQKEVAATLGVDPDRAGLALAPLIEKAALLALDHPLKWQVALAIMMQVITDRRRQPDPFASRLRPSTTPSAR